MQVVTLNMWGQDWAGMPFMSFWTLQTTPKAAQITHIYILDARYIL